VDVVLIGSRLWLWAAMLRILKHVVPIATLVQFAKVAPRRHAAALDQSRVEAYMVRKGRFPFRPPANCLERSFGAYRLLCRDGAKPELVVGVRRSAQRGVEGHVWVTVAGRVLAETSDDVASFTPIVTFDAEGRQRSTTSKLQLPNAKVF
jgi:hypothetical protein